MPANQAAPRPRSGARPTMLREPLVFPIPASVLATDPSAPTDGRLAGHRELFATPAVESNRVAPFDQATPGTTVLRTRRSARANRKAGRPASPALLAPTPGVGGSAVGPAPCPSRSAPRRDIEPVAAAFSPLPSPYAGTSPPKAPVFYFTSYCSQAVTQPCLGPGWGDASA